MVGFASFQAITLGHSLQYKIQQISKALDRNLTSRGTATGLIISKQDAGCISRL